MVPSLVTRIWLTLIDSPLATNSSFRKSLLISPDLSRSGASSVPIMRMELNEVETVTLMVALAERAESSVAVMVKL